MLEYDRVLYSLVLQHLSISSEIILFDHIHVSLQDFSGIHVIHVHLVRLQAFRSAFFGFSDVILNHIFLDLVIVTLPLLVNRVVLGLFDQTLVSDVICLSFLSFSNRFVSI